MTSPLVAKVDPLADADDYNYEIYSKLWCARAIPGPTAGGLHRGIP